MRRLLLATMLLGTLAIAQTSFAQEPEAGAAGEEAGETQVAALAEPPKARSLDELLELVRKGFREEREEDAARIQRFRREKAEQEKLLADAQARLAREEERSQRLEARFTENEGRLAEMEETLTQRLGTLGELFGVVRQVSGDAASSAPGSLTSAQLGPARQEFLLELGKSKELPDIEELEALWCELQREMTEQGRVVRFDANVLTRSGEEVTKPVVRAGVFTVVADGEYLHWDEAIQKLKELPKQPPAQYQSTVPGFESAQSGLAPLAVDPSRGTLLGLLLQTQSLVDRVPQGGWIGYTILFVGAATAFFGILRLLVIFVVDRKVAAQEKSKKVSTGNPLGRVLQVYEENREAEPETLEVRLDEAVLRESSRLERFIWFVKVISVLAPLGGLLGTVTGMIRTFQSITLFGAGDPKMMAGGISEALVTTMLGLVTAIPLVLLHALLTSSTKRINDVLEEQSAGLIARRMEETNA